MRTKVLVFLLTINVLSAFDAQQLNDRFRGHVRKINGRFEITTASQADYRESENDFQDTVASGSWDQRYNVTGWSVLEIKTFENYSNVDQAYAAGLLEGKLTRTLIDYQWMNSINDTCADGTDFCHQLAQYLGIQLDWIYSKIEEYPNEEYWQQARLLLTQLNGLIDGHDGVERGARYTLDNPLGYFLFQIVESIGDIRARLGFSDAERVDSCSALVKILPDKSDIYVSHADWSHYKTMLKVIKRYVLPFKRNDNTIIPGAETVFSSYPGTLHSVDDFYMMRASQLTVIETTIVNYNPDLTHQISPISVPEWMRIVISNRLSTSGRDWIDQFFLFNDGTYNNEWMILDYKKFTPMKDPEPEFLMVAEQMVNDFEYKDMTETLKTETYWGSYNNVYFPRFRDISHEEQMAETKGPALYSWNSSARAKIFQRDHHKVVNMTTMITMMRYNDFTKDPLSACNCTPAYSSELTIAARCDLNPVNGTYPDSVLGHRPHGATDAKITSSAMMKDFTLIAIAGPTNDLQPAFVWSESDFDKKFSHIGQPDRWEFGPYTPAWVLN